MGKVVLKIDEKEIVTEKEKTILQAALENGIYIPHLCYHPDISSFGGCRLCIVEIGERLAISCRTQVKEGLEVRTRSPRVDEIRRILVEMIFAEHHTSCGGCLKVRECELLKIGSYIHLERKKRLPRLRWATKRRPIDTSNPFFDFDPNKCVLCGICVRTCQEIQGLSALEFINRGYESKVASFGDKPFVQSACESCGECVIRCPVGALVLKEIKRPERKVKTVCPYCAVGCGIYLELRNDTVVGVEGEAESLVNKGSLCVKGRFGWSFINSKERLVSPLIKRNGRFVEVSWEEALTFVAKKFREYKGEEFALLASTKCTNEESYLFQKFARAVMGSNNVDNPARFCYLPSLLSLSQTVGLGATTNSLNEIEKAACLLIIGTNITQTHPIVGLKVRKAIRNGARLILINPREVDLSRSADVWLRPNPGTDVALLMGMCGVIVDEGLLDTAFIEKRTENFEEFKKSLEDFSLTRVERITGVSRELISKAAKLFATNKPGAVLFSSGITQYSQGMNGVFALSNLVLVTGNIGKAFSGLYPLGGQNNTQGACDMGCLPDFFPGYQRVEDEKVRKKFETAWGVNLNSNPGLSLTEVWTALLEGKVKAVYIIGFNPLLNMPHLKMVRKALERAEFVVVQDVFLNETANYADVFLPAATFAEKEGSFTNLERRIQKVRKAIEPRGNSRPDWEIICDLAKRLGSKGFDFAHPSEIMSEIAALTPIYRGISYERLEKETLQWPCFTLKDREASLLYSGEFKTPNGKAKFIPLEYNSSLEPLDVEYPLILITGRSLYHEGVLSSKVEGFHVLKEKDILEINPKDAFDFGVSDGKTVKVISRRGEVKMEARITDASPPGIVFATFHFPQTQVNILTTSLGDKESKIPALKACAVKIVPEE